MSTLKLFNETVTKAGSTKSKKEKEEIIRNSLVQNPELGKLFELALSPYITFGIAKLPEPANVTVPNAVDNAFLVLNRLATREATGQQARYEVSVVRATLDGDERDAFDRILLKDLRAGFTESTVNKAVPGTVPVFSCQLAPSELAKLDEITFPIIAEPKFDGVRTIAIKGDGPVQLFSRNGKLFENFAEIEDALNQHMGNNSVFDGEVLSPNGFQALMTRAKAKPGVATEVPIYYQVFDGMKLTDWKAQHCSAVAHSRIISVSTEVSRIPSRLVRVTLGRMCHNVQEVESFYAEVLAKGFEGLMLKNPSGHYTFKRNKNWLKLKPFDTVDLEVIGIVEGTGKYEGMMGALRCQGYHGEKLIRTEVGSGFTDQQRAELFRHMEGNEVAEVRYQEITKAQDGDYYSLRFPSFVRFRGGEKI